MALNFPNTPNDGDIFTDGDKSWQWDASSTSWISLGGGAGSTSLDIAGNSGTATIDTSADVLTFSGSTDQLTTTVSGSTVTLGLTGNLAITTNAGNANSAFGNHTTYVGSNDYYTVVENTYTYYGYGYGELHLKAGSGITISTESDYNSGTIRVDSARDFTVNALDDIFFTAYDTARLRSTDGSAVLDAGQDIYIESGRSIYNDATQSIYSSAGYDTSIRSGRNITIEGTDAAFAGIYLNGYQGTGYLSGNLLIDRLNQIEVHSHVSTKLRNLNDNRGFILDRYGIYITEFVNNSLETSYDAYGITPGSYYGGYNPGAYKTTDVVINGDCFLYNGSVRTTEPLIEQAYSANNVSGNHLVDWKYGSMHSYQVGGTVDFQTELRTGHSVQVEVYNPNEETVTFGENNLDRIYWVGGSAPSFAGGAGVTHFVELWKNYNDDRTFAGYLGNVDVSSFYTSTTFPKNGDFNNIGANGRFNN